MENIHNVFFPLQQILSFPGMTMATLQWLKYSHIPTPPPSSSQGTLILLITRYVLLWQTDDFLSNWHTPTKNVLLIPSGELRSPCDQGRSAPALNCGSQLVATWGHCRFPKTGKVSQQPISPALSKNGVLGNHQLFYFRWAAVLSQRVNKSLWRLWPLASPRALTLPRAHAANCRWWVWPRPWRLS